MSLLEKVRLLGGAGRWDVCASSASPRKASSADRIGDAAQGGICHSFTEGGRCVSLFKTLMANACSLDCAYCQNSIHCHKKPASYEPRELADVFMHLYLGNYVEGLFLSSAVAGDADSSMERMLEAVRILRQDMRFQGYIHLKVLPGADRSLVKEAGMYADRLSINIEAPSKSRLDELTSTKDYGSDILRRQEWIRRLSLPAGQTTQMVVGAAGESDEEVLEAAEWEYGSMGLRRVYYSVFTPIDDTPLAGMQRVPLEREHRLYCVDFMMRKYGIGLDEFRPVMAGGNLPEGDPKINLARTAYRGPTDVNSASYEELIRVPGLGPLSARRIMDLRAAGHAVKSRSQLASIGVAVKRADPFIKVNGHAQTSLAAYGG